MIRRHLAALWLRWDLSRAVRRRRRTIKRLAREANRAEQPHVPRHEASFPRPMSHDQFHHNQKEKRTWQK